VENFNKDTSQLVTPSAKKIQNLGNLDDPLSFGDLAMAFDTAGVGKRFHGGRNIRNLSLILSNLDLLSAIYHIPIILFVTSLPCTSLLSFCVYDSPLTGRFERENTLRVNTQHHAEGHDGKILTQAPTITNSLVATLYNTPSYHTYGLTS
jgi:hypothetical protein